MSRQEEAFTAATERLDSSRAVRRDSEEGVSSHRAGAGGGGGAGAGAGGQQQRQLIEQALQQAGTHLEHSVILSFYALLLACLMQTQLDEVGNTATIFTRPCYCNCSCTCNCICIPNCNCTYTCNWILVIVIVIVIVSVFVITFTCSCRMRSIGCARPCPTRASRVSYKRWPNSTSA